MSNSIKIFENNQFGQIRSIEKDGEPWFVAVDVCQALDIQNASQAVDRLDADERAMFNIGRQGKANMVNEYGLYNLILASRKTEAKEFKRWITHEVIPSIRKTGSYTVTAPDAIDYKKLPSTNHAASILMRSYKMAGANMVSLASTIAAMYRGIGVPVPALEAKVEEHLFDSEEIAAQLGILSESGKPHSHATKAVIRDLGITDDDGTIQTYERNGHSGTVVKYPPSVLDRVASWLDFNGWPRVIVLDKAYKVQYRR